MIYRRLQSVGNEAAAGREEGEFRNERARSTRAARARHSQNADEEGLPARYRRARTARGSNAFIMESIIADCVNFVVISRMYIQRRR